MNLRYIAARHRTARAILVLLAANALGAAQTPSPIHGNVADESGSAIAGATVTAEDTQGHSTAAVSTDSSGEFTFASLAPGSYTIRVEKTQFQSERVPVTVSANGQIEPLRITLKIGSLSETLTVTGDRDFTPPVDSSAASRTDTPIMELPRAVQIVSPVLLEDRQVTNVFQALENVSGVSKEGTFYDAFLIRGFDNSSNSYRNFLKTIALIGTEDFAFVDHVEVAKGPSSELYGRVAPGGVVNYVTKQPLEDSSFSFQQQVGSWGQVRSVADASGPLDRKQKLFYRGIFSFDQANSYILYQHHRDSSEFGALSWRPTERFTANIQVEGYNQRMSGNGYYGQQIPVIGHAPANLPWSWSSNDPAQWTYFPETSLRGLYTADWSLKVNDHVKVAQRFLYNRWRERQNYIINESFNATTGILTRRPDYNPMNRSSISGNTDVVTEFNTGRLHHTFLVGFDVYHWKQDDYGFNEGSPLHVVTDLNIYNPAAAIMTQGEITALQNEFNATISNVLYRSNQLNLGLYFQDQIRLAGRLSFLIGGRYDDARDAASAVYGTTATSCFPKCTGYLVNQPTEKQLSPATGLSIRLVKQISLYGSYSKSFSSSNTAIVYGTGVVDPPQKARQYETGLKGTFLEGRIFASATVFRLFQYNLSEADPLHPGYSNLIGQARSEGFEFDITGRMTRHVSLAANYTYDDAAVVAANGVSRVDGRRLAQVPRHVGNLWARYDTAPGSTRGFMFGTGVYTSSDFFGESANTVLLPGYARLDGMIGYRTRTGLVHWTAQLNAANLLDRKYFLYGDPFTYGAPRSLIFSLKAQIAPKR